jgi:adenylate cyclase
MGIEIERKFLVTDDGWRDVVMSKRRMQQWYISTDPARTVRVRIDGDSHILGIKGKPVGLSRTEVEVELHQEDALQLFDLRADGTHTIDKIRSLIKFDGLIWEVDEFLGVNKGLITVEVELDDESQRFVKPHWVGAEVSNDFRYSNSTLAMIPFSEWVKV